MESMKNCQCIDDHNHKTQHVPTNSNVIADQAETSVIVRIILS